MCKADFVKGPLREMLVSMDPDVFDAVDYVKDSKNEEYVVVTTTFGLVQKILITADNLSAIVRDVINKLFY